MLKLSSENEQCTKGLLGTGNAYCFGKTTRMLCTLSVLVSLILALAEHVLQLWYIFVDHHMGTCRTNS